MPRRATRCSTDAQDVDIQTEQLTALGVTPERIYIDCGFSGTRRTNRAGLDQALAALSCVSGVGSQTAL